MITWDSYAKQFQKEASDAGEDGNYIAICLKYAFNLFSSDLPIIYDATHFSKLVGYNLEYIVAAQYRTKSFYRHFSIKKVCGGVRDIYEPLPSLKEIQRWILDNILYKCNYSEFAKGFVIGKSIRDNARFHRKQPKVLSLDIENFFPSIKAGRIYNLFKRLGYQPRLVHLLTSLCTLNGCLPQGAPTSPALSNLISFRIDKRLSGFALKQKVRYTRYADDITFSGDFDEGKLIKFTRKILVEEGFKLNENKTRLMKQHQRQEVTGIVVNQYFQAPRTTRRELRKSMFYIKKYGIESHMQFLTISRANYIKHLLGIANFILFVNPNDAEVKEYIKYLHNLESSDLGT